MDKFALLDSLEEAINYHKNLYYQEAPEISDNLYNLLVDCFKFIKRVTQ